MVIYENITHPDTGEEFIRAYSDNGMKIHGGFPESDYVEAIDPADKGRTYTETNIPIEPDPEPTVEEKAQAYDVLVGGAE